METIKFEDISREDYERYEEVRVGGRTNMFFVQNVMALSGLSKDMVMAVMQNYSELKKKYEA